MSIIIRQEEPQDFEAVFGLIRQAFEGEEHSDHREQFLVERLRNSDAFVPELSLVAETGGTLAGHILLTKVKIVSDCAEEAGSLALAPVAVLLSCTWIAVRIDSNSARLFHGLVMKSNAPARIPCTARWIEPHAVIRITGTSGASTLTFASSSSPSSPVVERV